MSALPEQDHDAQGVRVHTTEVSMAGLPMNAYTIGYGHGIMGMGMDKGMVGSSRYSSGYVDGRAQWDYYLSMAMGTA